MIRPLRSYLHVRNLHRSKLHLLSQRMCPEPKVVRMALQDAASVSGLVITTEVLVMDKPELKISPTPPEADHGF